MLVVCGGGRSQLLTALWAISLLTGKNTGNLAMLRPIFVRPCPV